MKRLFVFFALLILFCKFFMGCHTLDKLSRVNTGNVDVRDLWEAFLADDREMEEKYW